MSSKTVKPLKNGFPDNKSIYIEISWKHCVTNTN